MIHDSAIVAPDAQIGVEPTVGPYVVIGVDGPGDPTFIGANAVIRSHTVIYRSCAIGDNFQTGHGVLVRNDCAIGDDVSIGSHTTVEFDVRLARGVRLHSGCFVPERSVLEEGAWLGPGVIVTNAKYPNAPDAKANLEGVHIGPGAAIGAGAVLLPGVRIGAGALIGAGAVVVGDVPDGSRVVGNPGRILT